MQQLEENDLRNKDVSKTKGVKHQLWLTDSWKRMKLNCYIFAF